MSNVETSGHVGGRCWNNENILGFALRCRKESGGNLGFEKALGRPPVIPRGLDGDRIVSGRHGLRQIYNFVGKVSGKLLGRTNLSFHP